jgi:PAS domain S-box-containing protein
MRLRQQLLLLTLGPLVIGAAGGAALLWPAADRLAVQAADGEAREQLSVQSLTLEAELRSIQARLDAYASLPVVRDGDPMAITQLLAPLRRAVPGIDALNFIAADGTVRVTDGRTLSVRDRYYFADLQAGKPVVTKAIVDIDAGGAELLILRPVRTSQGAVKGAVGASIRLEDVLSRVKRIKLTHPGFAVLVDADGRALSSAPIGVAAATALLPDTSGVAIPTEWREMLSSIRATPEGTTRVVLGGAPHRVYFRELPVIGWRLAIGVDEASMLAERRRVTLEALALLLALAALGSGAALLIRQRVERPIARLVDAHEALGAGNLDARAPVAAQPELAQLAQSFNRLAGDLQEGQQRRLAAEQAEAEAVAALAEGEALLRAIFDATPTAMAVFRESDGRYLRANETFARWVGTTPDAIREAVIDEISIVRDPKRRAELRALRRSTGSFTGERVSLTGPNGEERDVLLSALSFEINGERLVLSTATDISALVKLEAQLRHASQLEVVGRLAGGVAHDFNNMLAGILGAADLLDLSMDSDSPLLEDVDIIRTGARRAAALTQQLLRLARPHAAADEPFDVHEPLRTAVALARRTFPPRIIIRDSLDAKGSWTRGDAALLHTVFLNLAVNARDAMPDGGILHLRTSNDARGPEGSTTTPGSEPASPWLKVEITDTGHGMPPDVISRIFEPFYTTKPVGKGTGLGLSVALGVVKAQGGHLGVASTPGEGTTFTLWLPTATAPGDAADRHRFAGALTPGSRRVLVAEDEPLVRTTITRSLERAGHTVHEVADGAAALALLDQGTAIDVAVIDLLMPGLDGAHTFDGLRSRRPDLPVIVCSGHDEDGVLRRIAESPGVTLLAKPFGPAELTAVVARASAANAVP